MGFDLSHIWWPGIFPCVFKASIFLREADYLSHSQLQVLFLLTVYSLSIFGYEECNQFGFSIDQLLMSMCKVTPRDVKKRYFLWLVHSLGRIQVAFARFHFVLQGQTCLLLLVTLDFLLLHSSPQWWIEHLFLVLVPGGLVGLHRTDHLQLLQDWW